MYKKYRKGVSCVIYYLSKNKILYLLLHRKKHWTGWEFTKGGKKVKEKIESTLKREIKEETGQKPLTFKKFKFKGSFIYDKKTQKEKRVKGFRYILFACNLKNKKVMIDKEEHDGYRWLPYNKAMKLLKWQDQKKRMKFVNRWLKTYPKQSK